MLTDDSIIRDIGTEDNSQVISGRALEGYEKVSGKSVEGQRKVNTRPVLASSDVNLMT